MLPGNVDPRRADKQQRYKPPPSSNNAAPGEDLTPDYMNILDSQKKSMHSSNRSDRFKVVKIESTEPFKRGRWECMDFLDRSYNRIFQHNYVANKSSDTNAQTSLHSSRMESQKIASRTSWGNNIDLQSSMLEIFYRQNTSIANIDKIKTISTPQKYSSSLDRVSCSDNACTYRNHVLRPGMVSSSLVGVKYPLELNFQVEKDVTDPSHSPINGAMSPLRSDLPHMPLPQTEVCACNNYNVHNTVVNSNVMIETQQSIQNELTVPTYQAYSYVQQNYSIQNSGDFIYQNTNGLTNPQQYQYLPSSPNKPTEYIPQEQINSCQVSSSVNDIGVLSVPSIAQTEYVNKSFEADTYSENNLQYNDTSSLNILYSPGSNYQEFRNAEQQSCQTLNSTSPSNYSTTDFSSNLSYYQNLPTSNTSMLNNQSQSQIQLDLSTASSRMSNQFYANVTQDIDPFNNNQNFNTNDQSSQTTFVDNQYIPTNLHSCTAAQVSTTNIQEEIKNLNNEMHNVQLNSTHPSPGSSCQRVLFPENISTNGPMFTQPFLLPLVTTQIHVPFCLPTHNLGNNTMPKSIEQSVNDATIPQGYFLMPHSINTGFLPTIQQPTAVVAPSSPVPRSVPIPNHRYQEVEGCIHTILGNEKISSATNENDEQAPKYSSPDTIDTKIEALMDLVKMHLKLAVQEDVDLLNQRITMLNERIAQLEHENELLRRRDCTHHYKN